MPNHITNILTVEGEERIVDFIFKVIQGSEEKQFIDFNKIIPAPAFIFNQSAGNKEEALCLEFDCPIWTNFNRENWGTKWNAYSQEKIDASTIKYETAWSSSHKVIQKIADKFPMVKITLKFADEYAGCNTGVLIWHNGVTTENIPVNQSIEAYNLYFELHPEHKDDYKLIDGKYEYVDDF